MIQDSVVGTTKLRLELFWVKIQAGDGIFFFPIHPDWLRSSLSFLFNGYSALSWKQGSWDVKLTSYLQPVLRLRMSEAIPPFHTDAFIAWTRTTITLLWTMLSYHTVQYAKNYANENTQS
jgi:hypothetical protein